MSPLAVQTFSRRGKDVLKNKPALRKEGRMSHISFALHNALHLQSSVFFCKLAAKATLICVRKNDTGKAVTNSNL